MSTVDLASLPAPEVLEPLEFEAVYAEELADFRAYMGDQWNAALESDPVVKLLEQAAYRRMQNRARVNSAAKALLLAYAEGSDLDQFGGERQATAPGDTGGRRVGGSADRAGDGGRRRVAGARTASL